jgi:hypothetical protein
MKDRAKLNDLFNSFVPITPTKDLPVIKVPKRSGRLKSVYDGLPTIDY